MRWLAAPTVTITLLAVAGCSRWEGQQYFPEPSTETRYEYSVQYFAPMVGVQRGKMVVQVDGEETIKGKEYYKIVVVVSGIPGWNPTTHYLRYSSQGIFRVSAEHKEKPECLEIPLPLHVGAAWTADCPDGETSYRAEGIETVYLLERKHENCLKITWNREKESMVERGTMYFAPGVGEVRGTLSVGNLTMDYVLEKYRH